MEASFVICLLAASITLGMSRECAICQSSGRNCQGSQQPCPGTEDKCSIILSERSFGPAKQVTMKSCIHSKECNKGLAVLDVGKNRTILGQVSCCEGDQCTNPSSLPPRKTVTTKKKRCPACYIEPNEQKECEEKMIDCTGQDEIYCAELFLHTKEGGKNVTITMKGCANEAFCEKKEISAIDSTFTLLPSSFCRNATGAVGPVAGSFGLFLSAQAGLLLVTIFS